jgi:hypothetical protein
MSVELSVQPEWCRRLPLQQQSVLLLAARGPDGIRKKHPAKEVHIAYRGCILLAAKYGRCLEWGERADSFMSLDVIANDELWLISTRQFLLCMDDLPLHYVMHLAYGAEILGYKHPDQRLRKRWIEFYFELVKELHLNPESEADMDRRLGDWEREHWSNHENMDRAASSG